MQSPRKLLWAGILLRLVVFVFLAPLNGDTGHFDNVTYVLQHRAIPRTGDTTQSHHPPLYYLLAAPFLRATGSAKGVQVLSLLFSLATLMAFYHLIYREQLLVDRRSRLYSFWLVCFLPPFVLDGLWVTNDTMATFLGALVIWRTLSFVEQPSERELVLLALCMQIALLTKHTFLPFLPVLLGTVIFVQAKNGHSIGRLALSAMIFLVLSIGVAGYKCVENQSRFGTPFTLGPLWRYEWVPIQQQTYGGVRSFVDVNLLKLIASPVASRATTGSYPLLLYGTFWYVHLGAGSFVGSNRRPFNYLGSLIYIAAILPTAACLFGGLVLLKEFPGFLKTCQARGRDSPAGVVRYVALGSLLGCLGMLFAAIYHYHIWSLMQARLFYSSFFGLLVAFDRGVVCLHSLPRVERAFDAAWRVLLLLFFAYFASEIGYQVLVRFFPSLQGYLKSVSSLSQ